MHRYIQPIQMSHLLKTRIRHPSEWCEAFQPLISEESYKLAGKWVTIDINSLTRSSLCNGRLWKVIDAEPGVNPEPGISICEHNIEIGD